MENPPTAGRGQPPTRCPRPQPARPGGAQESRGPCGPVAEPGRGRLLTRGPSRNSFVCVWTQQGSRRGLSAYQPRVTQPQGQDAPALLRVALGLCRRSCPAPRVPAPAPRAPCSRRGQSGALGRLHCPRGQRPGATCGCTWTAPGGRGGKVPSQLLEETRRILGQSPRPRRRDQHGRALPRAPGRRHGHGRKAAAWLAEANGSSSPPAPPAVGPLGGTWLMTPSTVRFPMDTFLTVNGTSAAPPAAPSRQVLALRRFCR